MANVESLCVVLGERACGKNEYVYRSTLRYINCLSLSLRSYVVYELFDRAKDEISGICSSIASALPMQYTKSTMIILISYGE